MSKNGKVRVVLEFDLVDLDVTSSESGDKFIRLPYRAQGHTEGLKQDYTVYLKGGKITIPVRKAGEKTPVKSKTVSKEVSNL